MKTNVLRFAVWILLVLVGQPALASEGHGHDHGAGTVAVGPALPRFAATSELFELVGVLDGRQLTLYLDRFADNAPVRGARIDLEVGGAKVALKESEPGEFKATLAREPQQGITPVTATVMAGNDSDLLAGDLVVQGPPSEAAHKHGWREYAAWVAGPLVMGGAALWGWRRLVARRRASAGGAA